MNFKTRPLLSRMLHMLMEHDNDETLWKWDSCTHDLRWRGNELNFMDSYAFLLLFPWQHARGNYYWIHLIKQYGDTSKWENIYFPAMVLELFFFSSLYKILTWLCLKFRVTSHTPGFLSRLLTHLASPPRSSLPFNPCPPHSVWVQLSEWSLLCPSSLCSEPARGCLPCSMARSCSLSLLSFWSHWILIFLDRSKNVCVATFLSPVPEIFLPTLSPLKKKTKKTKLHIYKKSWKNSTANTHVHLDSPINTFHICFVFLPPSFLARINIKWLLLFVCWTIWE